ncbi:MAG: hypothetical protein ACLFUW_01160 [Bacteroidales bacterium]
MKQYFIHIIYAGLLILSPNAALTQEYDNTIKNCKDYLNNEYINSGQNYVANLNKNNKAVFHTTFYEGTQYRIVACSDLDKYPLILEVFDTERNLLFSNKDHQYTPYWDLLFTSTVTCTIEISIEAEKHLKEPVKLLIGFKNKSLNFD